MQAQIKKAKVKLLLHDGKAVFDDALKQITGALFDPYVLPDNSLLLVITVSGDGILYIDKDYYIDMISKSNLSNPDPVFILNGEKFIDNISNYVVKFFEIIKANKDESQLTIEGSRHLSKRFYKANFIDNFDLLFAPTVAYIGEVLKNESKGKWIFKENNIQVVSGIRNFNPYRDLFRDYHNKVRSAGLSSIIVSELYTK